MIFNPLDTIGLLNIFLNAMLTDALRWNMLNVVRVELFFNCYQIWTIFTTGSLKSPRGQYAIVSLIITVLAQFAVQFNFNWLLTIYSIYLAAGMCAWLHRRVYFYHRRLDSVGVNQTIHQFDQAKLAANQNNHHYSNNTGTLGKGGDKHHSAANNNGTNNAGSSSSSSSSSVSENTNSLQRQRANAYREFQSVLNEPRYKPQEHAISLAHLSHLAKLVANKDVFDEMHFQILATRRDVVNIVTRSVLLAAATLLMQFQ